MLGLYAFFYGSLHFLVYTIADRFAGLDFPDGMASWTTARNLAASVGEDIYKRPFITIGFTALMLMLPLEALEHVAQAGLPGGSRRGGALLLAGEGRRAQPAALRGDRDGAARCARLLGAREGGVGGPRTAGRAAPRLMCHRTT